MGRWNVTIRVPGRGSLRATYEPYSPYVDLYFGYSESPYETIRIWDDDEESGPAVSGTTVRRVVSAWVREMDRDPAWSTWYEDILAATEQ